MENSRKNSLQKIITITLITFIVFSYGNNIFRKYSYLISPYLDSGFSEVEEKNRLEDVIANNKLNFNVGENLIATIPKQDEVGQRVIKPSLLDEPYLISDNMEYLYFFGIKDGYFYVNINGEYVNLNKIEDEGRYTRIDGHDIFISKDGKNFALVLNTPEKHYAYINGKTKEFSYVSNLSLSPELGSSFVSDGRSSYVNQKQINLGYDIRKSFFSPDGKELFLWGEKKNSQDSYFILYNSDQKFLSNTYEPEVYFSKNGDSYAFRGSEGSVFSNKYHTVFNGKTLPNYDLVRTIYGVSPDGKKVAYSAQKVLHGEEWWLLINDKEYGPYKDEPRDFIFSHDSKNFAYSVYDYEEKQTTVFKDGVEVVKQAGHIRENSILFNPVNNDLVFWFTSHNDERREEPSRLFIDGDLVDLQYIPVLRQIIFDKDGNIIARGDIGNLYKINSSSKKLDAFNRFKINDVERTAITAISHIFDYGNNKLSFVAKALDGNIYTDEEYILYNNQRKSENYDKIIRKSIVKDGKMIFFAQRDNEIWSIVIEE